MIEILNKLYDDGSFKKLIGAGLLSQRAATYRAVYLHYCKMIEDGDSVVDAVKKTCEKLKVGQTTVYKSIKIMKAA